MDIMSLTGIPSIASEPSMIEVAMLSKSLDTFQAAGESLTQMMELSVNPNLGQNIDIKV
jgi:hypothetical protein